MKKGDIVEIKVRASVVATSPEQTTLILVDTAQYINVATAELEAGLPVAETPADPTVETASTLT